MMMREAQRGGRRRGVLKGLARTRGVVRGPGKLSRLKMKVKGMMMMTAAAVAAAAVAAAVTAQRSRREVVAVVVVAAVVAVARMMIAGTLTMTQTLEKLSPSW